MMHNTYSNTLVTPALALTEITSDTDTAGTAVDCGLHGNNFRDALFAVSAHALTDGAYTVAVEESSASGSGYAAVDPARILGSLPSFAASDDNAVKSFGVRPTKRYLRIVVTSATTTSGGSLSAVAVLGNGSNRPASRS